MEPMSDNDGDSEKVHVWTVEVQGEPIQDHGEPAPHVTPADEAAADEGGPTALLHSGRTVRGNAAWMRRWAWAIALVLTMVAFGVLLPIFGPRLLVVLPLSWLITFFSVRLAATSLLRDRPAQQARLDSYGRGVSL